MAVATSFSAETANRLRHQPSHGLRLAAKLTRRLATGQNNLAMNRTVAQLARHYVRGGTGDIPEPMLNRIEHGIRCYDTCLSCSTHAVGQKPLRVQLIAPDGAVVREVTRG